MNKNTVKEFINEMFGEVTVIQQEDDSRIWFIVNEIYEKLGYSQAKDLYSKCDKEEIMTFVINENHRKSLKDNGKRTIVSFDGLTDACSNVRGKRKDIWKQFRKWVNNTIIPALYNDGAYIDGEENVQSEDELIKLGYEALMKKCERLEKQLTKGNVICYKTGKTYKTERECSQDTGYDATTIRNHCRCVGGIPIDKRLFGYVGAIYNGSGELWVRCLNTGEISATARYFDRKYSLPDGTTGSICLGKIESYNGLDFIFEEHEKDSTYYYKN